MWSSLDPPPFSIRCIYCCMNCNILVMEQVEDTQHTKQNKENTLKSLLLQKVVPLWTETDFLKERKKNWAQTTKRQDINQTDNTSNPNLFIFAFLIFWFVEIDIDDCVTNSTLSLSHYAVQLHGLRNRFVVSSLWTILHIVKHKKLHILLNHSAIPCALLLAQNITKKQRTYYEAHEAGLHNVTNSMWSQSLHIELDLEM
jgi:hypothetical protein